MLQESNVPLFIIVYCNIRSKTGNQMSVKPWQKPINVYIIKSNIDYIIFTKYHLRVGVTLPAFTCKR